MRGLIGAFLFGENMVACSLEDVGEKLKTIDDEYAISIVAMETPYLLSLPNYGHFLQNLSTSYLFDLFNLFPQLASL